MPLNIFPITLNDPRLAALVAELDKYQCVLYPDGSNYAMPLERMANAQNYPFLAESEGLPVGCACLYLGDNGIAEIKRVYVAPAGRGKGVASRLIQALEAHGQALNITTLFLETGIYQPEAIGLYQKLGYDMTGPFGDYTFDPLSVYMVKTFPATIANV